MLAAANQRQSLLIDTIDGDALILDVAGRQRKTEHKIFRNASYFSLCFLEMPCARGQYSRIICVPTKLLQVNICFDRFSWEVKFENEFI